MLVINANNQQDTTNYMLTEPGYPDTDSILMRGGPQVIHNFTANTTVTGQGINDSPVIDTIGTEPINFYCPKIYKNGLRQGVLERRVTQVFTSGTQVPVDFGTVLAVSNNNFWYKINGDTGYRIAVKGLQAGQVVGEKIIAPLLFGTMGTTSVNATGTISIIFGLLHSDGTKTTIATITPTWVGGTVPYSSGKIIQALNTMFYIQTALRLGTYNGTGQIAQDGDILYADVLINNFITYNYSNATYNANFCPIGIMYGGTNNNSLRDPDGFRPFQVSIRDA